MVLNLTITPIFAALLTVLYIALTLRVIQYRRTGRVAFGDAGRPEVVRAIRAHGNFAEYVPLALILMTLAEVQGAQPVYLWLTGAVLVLARLSHAASLLKLGPYDRVPMRTIGMTATFAVLAALAILAVLA